MPGLRGFFQRYLLIQYERDFNHFSGNFGGGVTRGQNNEDEGENICVRQQASSKKGTEEQVTAIRKRKKMVIDRDTTKSISKAPR